MTLAPQPRFSLTATLELAVTMTVILGCAVGLSLNVADPDLWGHVTYGRDALQTGLAQTTTYSYTAQNYPWVNHEILAEFVLALVGDAGGIWANGCGLMWLKTGIGLAVVVPLLISARVKGIGLTASAALPLLVTAVLANYFCLRPQLGSYMFFTVELLLLNWCFADWEDRWHLPLPRSWGGANFFDQNFSYSRKNLRLLWLAPILIMVWTNTHGGFLAGLCVLIAYLGLRCFEAICRLGRAADGLVIRLLLLGVVTALVMVINPYGWQFLVWIFDDLTVPRPEITEWRPPNWADPTSLPLILLIALFGLCLLFSRKQRDFTQTTILGLLLWQSVTHDRHVPFFALACGFWLPTHVESLLARLSGNDSPEEVEQPPKPALQVLLLAGVLAFSVGLGYQLYQKNRAVLVERDVYPVAAIDYMVRQQLSGRTLVAFNWSQYLLAALGKPDSSGSKITVDVDGRCRTSYSQAMLDRHFDFLLGEVPASERYRGPDSGPLDPLAALTAGGPQLALISRGQPHAEQIMNSQRDRWVLLHQDAISQLWGQTALFGDPRSERYVPFEHREISETMPTGWSKWPAIPIRN